MGLLSFLFGSKEPPKEQNTPTPTQPAVNTTTFQPNVHKPKANNGILNLEKGGILNLTKTGMGLSKLRVAAGWDVNVTGGLLAPNYDLDLCALTRNKSGDVLEIVYFGNKRGFKGALQLDQDNLTGEDDNEKVNGLADDETIFVNLEALPEKVEQVEFYVVIYNAAERKQTFTKVRNAFARLWDDSDKHNPKEVVRFNLSGTKDETANAVHVLNLHKKDGEWEFEAIETYMRTRIGDLR